MTTMKALVALLVLLSAASALALGREKPPAAVTIAAANHVKGGPALRRTTKLGAGRHLMTPVRRLLGNDERSTYAATTFTPTFMQIGAACPIGDPNSIETLYDAGGYMLGTTLVNNGVCGTLGTVSYTGAGGSTPAYYGATTQDFVVASKANWETYGWAKFTTPADTAKPTANQGGSISITGVNLHLLTSVGTGSVGNCQLDSVSIAIFGDSGNKPDAANMLTSVKVTMTGVTWTTNTSRILAFDIIDMMSEDNAAGITVADDTAYWLRVKFYAPYTGAGTGKCFTAWGMRDTGPTGSRGRWQEKLGGANGYSTTCLGAKDNLDGSIVSPLVGQSYFNCFNAGAATAGAGGDTTATRRCLTYRTQLSPMPKATDCNMKFHDFNFGILGKLGEPGAAGTPAP